MLGCGSCVKIQVPASKLKLTKKTKNSVAQDLEIAEQTQASVERKYMYYNMSGGWAHRVYHPDHPKLVESMSDFLPSKTDYPPLAIFNPANQTPVYPDLPSSPLAYANHPAPL